jgi:phage baseplate assembly protein gpV
MSVKIGLYGAVLAVLIAVGIIVPLRMSGSVHAAHLSGSVSVPGSSTGAQSVMLASLGASPAGQAAPAKQASGSSSSGSSAATAGSSAAHSAAAVAAPATKVPLHCAASPHVCGYPDGTNTGVPASVHLLKVPGQVTKGKGWHYDPRGWVEVDGNGAVLQGLYIPYTLDISASNVTVTDVEVVDTGQGFGISLRHTSHVSITHSSIFSPAGSGPDRLQVAIKDIYADSTGLVIQRNNIYHVSTGIQISAGVVSNNYVHDLGYQTGDHLDGIASDSGDSHGLTINHNTIFLRQSQTTAIGLFEDFGTQLDCVIENNLIAGGGYTLYAGANPGGQRTSNIKVIGNRFSRIYYSHSGFYGPYTAYDAHAPGNKWSANIWDNTGKTIAG